MEVARRKVLRLQVQIEGSSTVQRLRHELKEYKEVLKCSICVDRPKEVVVTKCYLLFCNPFVQKIIGSRLPVCAASFGQHLKCIAQHWMHSCPHTGSPFSCVVILER